MYRDKKVDRGKLRFVLPVADGARGMRERRGDGRYRGGAGG